MVKMDYWDNENCFLCCKRDIDSKRCGLGGNNVKDALKNLFEVLGISFTATHAVWCSSAVFNTRKLIFCNDCDTLVASGVNLRTRLVQIKSQLVDNALGSSRQRKIDPVQEARNLLPEIRRIRKGIRNVIIQDLSKGGKEIANTTTLPESTFVPSGKNSGSTVNVSARVGVGRPRETHPPKYIFNRNKPHLSLSHFESIMLQLEPTRLKNNSPEPEIVPVKAEDEYMDTYCRPMESPLPLNSFQESEEMFVNTAAFGHGNQLTDESQPLADPLDVDQGSTPPNTPCIKIEPHDENVTTIDEMEEELGVSLTGRKRRRCTLKVNYAAMLSGGDVGRDNQSDDDTPNESDNDSWADGMSDYEREEVDRDIAAFHGHGGLTDGGGPVSFESHQCTTCSDVFTSAKVLNVHIQEIHSDSESNLSYKCDTCDLELGKDDVLHKANFPINEPYLLAIGSEKHYFEHFYELCECHFLRCRRVHELKKIQKDYKENQNLFDSTSSSAIMPPESNYYGDYNVYKSCFLCFGKYRDDILTFHYDKYHGLEFMHNRFACKYCKEMYMSESPTEGSPSRIFKPEEAEHFKEFAKKHSDCKVVTSDSKEYKCQQCAQVFPLHLKLIDHEIRIHSKDAPFQCDLCNGQFINWNCLNSHSKTRHKTKVRVHCGRCPASFLNRLDYIGHSRQHADKQKLRCHICSEQIEGLTKFNNHLKTHNTVTDESKEVETSGAEDALPYPKRIRYYKCFVCEKTFLCPLTMQLHIREIHDSENQTLSYKCRKCEQVFNQTEHTRINEAQLGNPSCNSDQECKKLSKFSDFCEYHARTCTAAPSSETRSYDCNLCEQTFPYNADLYRHMKCHNMHLLQKCSICVFTCGSSDSEKMLKHYRCKHNLKQTFMSHFSCRYCFRYFESENLEIESGRFAPEDINRFRSFVCSHRSCTVKSHDRITSFKCRFCDESSDSPINLFTHEIRNHTHRFPFYCDQCKLGYLTSAELSHHKKTHGATRDFKCDKCPAAYFRSSGLKAHLLRHEVSGKAHMCEECGKCFQLRRDLYRHKHSTHKEALVPCHICGKICRNKDMLYSHIRQVHERNTKIYRQTDAKRQQRAQAQHASSSTEVVEPTSDLHGNNESVYLQL